MNPTIAYSKKNEKFFLIAIVFLLFIATRMYWMFSREFWYDEVFTAMIIKEPWDVMLTHIRQDVHPPLYYIALKVWTYATGINNIGLRSFSVFCNALNIFALYIFLKKYFSDKLLTHFLIILIALNPLFILYSTEARMYAMLSLFYFLAVYCFLQASKDPKKIAPWILFIIFYTLSIYTHYIALFGIIPFFLYIVFIKDKIANLYKLYVSSLIGFLVFSPWLPIFLQQKNSNPNGLLWLTLPGIHSLIKTLLVMIFGNLVISIILVPFFLALRSAQLYLVVITLGMAFGLFFDLLIRDIDDLEKKHYIIAALFIPALAAIDVFYMTQFANFLEGLMKIENLHNPLLAGIAYALAFILPYCVRQLVANSKKGW